MCIHVKVRDAALFFIMYADDTVLFSETGNAVLFRAVPNPDGKLK